MRSLIKTSVVATLALAFAAGGAFAAQSHETHMPSSDRVENGDYYQGLYPNDGAISAPVPIIATEASAAVIERPRLAGILHALRAADRRMDAERSQGKLSGVAFNRLRREEASLRAGAMQVAARHHGMLPYRSYTDLQRDVRRLDWNIARAT